MKEQEYFINCLYKVVGYKQIQRMIDVRYSLDQQLAAGAIYIINTFIGDEGVYRIIERATPSLRTLGLKGAFSGSEALKAFPEGMFNNLITVELKNNRIDNIGCKYLSKCSFNNMRKFSLASNFLDAGGVIHLQKAKWPTVTSFSLYHNVVGEQGVKFIGKFQFDKLESLCIKGCYVSMSDIVPLMAFQYPLERLYMSIPTDSYFENVKKFETVVEQKFHGLTDYDFI